MMINFKIKRINLRIVREALQNLKTKLIFMQNVHNILRNLTFIMQKTSQVRLLKASKKRFKSLTHYNMIYWANLFPQ